MHIHLYASMLIGGIILIIVGIVIEQSISLEISVCTTRRFELDIPNDF